VETELELVATEICRLILWLCIDTGSVLLNAYFLCLCQFILFLTGPFTWLFISKLVNVLL